MEGACCMLPLALLAFTYCFFTALHTLKDWIRLETMAAFIFRNYVMHDNACLFLFLVFREEHSFSGSSESTKGGCALFIKYLLVDRPGIALNVLFWSRLRYTFIKKIQPPMLKRLKSRSKHI